MQAELAVGVQTQGGLLHVLLPRGVALPASRSAVFTTCEDAQTEVAIKVLALDAADDAILLGSFELAGIAPAPTGVPQVVVTLGLSVDGVLHVTAVDRQANRTGQITIRDRMPTPSR
jgi:molecular chaperone DnaK